MFVRLNPDTGYEFIVSMVYGVCEETERNEMANVIKGPPLDEIRPHLSIMSAVECQMNLLYNVLQDVVYI